MAGFSARTASCAASRARNRIPKALKPATPRTCSRCRAMKATGTSILFPSIRNIIPLVDYLGNAREYLDVICDQTDAGMSIVAGSQEYSIRANWKLLTENSIDGYHAMTTHASYFDILMNSTDNMSARHGRRLRLRSRQRARGAGICRAVGPAGRAVDPGLGRGRKDRNRAGNTTNWSSSTARTAPIGSR